MRPNHDKELLKIFGELYPNPRSELNFRNNYELVVSVSLSAQCTDKKVNEITPHLFSRYDSFAKLEKASLPAVEKIIRPINYYRTKAKNLIGMACKVVADFKGELPTGHADLISLPGVGNKTANVIQSELGSAHTFPVDAHVFRVSKRLALAKGKDVLEVEEELRKRFKSNLWRPLHHWLIFHGRRVCKAQRPLCAECRLASLCPSKGRC